MEKTSLILPACVIAIAIVIFGGLTRISGGFEVDVGYINGVLTASSILFGFWATLLTLTPMVTLTPEEQTDWFYSRQEWWRYYSVFRWEIIGSLILFAGSLALVYLSATRMISSGFALIGVSVSFFLNALFLGMHLHFYFEFLKSRRKN